MKSISVNFELFNRTETKTIYKLTYNEESYFLSVKHDGKYHNKLYECEKEIPKELVRFVDSLINEEIKHY